MCQDLRGTSDQWCVKMFQIVDSLHWVDILYIKKVYVLSNIIKVPRYNSKEIFPAFNMYYVKPACNDDTDCPFD